MSEKLTTLTKNLLAKKEYYDKFNQDIDLACQQFGWLMLKNDKLLQCSEESIARCAKQFLILNLQINQGGDQIYLIPRGKTCKLEIGYRGLEQLLFRTREVEYLCSQLVRKSTPFVVKKGEVIPSINTMSWGLDKEDPILGVVAYLKPVGRHLMFEPMTVSQIDACKRCSKGGSAWKNFYGEMARKSAIRRLIKHAMETLRPKVSEVMSTQLETALETDIDDNDSGAYEGEVIDKTLSTEDGFKKGLVEEEKEATNA